MGTISITNDHGRTRIYQVVLDESKLTNKERSRLLEVGRGEDYIPALDITPKPPTILERILCKGKERLS